MWAVGCEGAAGGPCQGPEEQFCGLADQKCAGRPARRQRGEGVRAPAPEGGGQYLIADGRGFGMGADMMQAYGQMMTMWQCNLPSGTSARLDCTFDKGRTRPGLPRPRLPRLPGPLSRGWVRVLEQAAVLPVVRRSVSVRRSATGDDAPLPCQRLYDRAKTPI